MIIKGNALVHLDQHLASITLAGHRPRSGRSQHSNCYAADIRVPGVSEKKILAVAASAPGIGGIGRWVGGQF